MTKKATVITYGCQMNVNESAKIKKILENLGYELTDNIEETDIAFLNTCTVREGAATQIYGKLGEIKRVREERGTKIVVTGCFAQEQGRELIKKFNYIDIVMGNQNIGRIPEAIEEIENRSTKHVVMTDYEDELPPRIDADFESKKTASIAITYGCNNFCTYCIVPYVRGRERSVPMAELIEEARELVRKGYKEIILLGQNVNSYGKGLSENETFANLLQNICNIEGDFIIRFVSPHPRDFTDDVIDVIARNPKIARSLHLPLQSGSTRVLKLMNRGYSKEQYIALAEKIKERIPGVSLTADIIVGFPQETEEDFIDTLDVVEKVGFETSFMFMYSIRKGTKAAVMEGQIDDEVKKDRLHRLMSLQNSISKKLSMEYEGKTERVLVEGPSKKNKDMLSSRTSTNKIVLFKGDPSLEGQFVNVKIKECKTWTLYGELAEK
ncbi:tRNA (N6-isopentenyl adenosine(37)-C2)-methylthiotransferase MiaB [Fusobacterium sp. SB021]|uniref:tRNA (N6-isopentenyl adenosine(37)-C2)-methylthiotransferase MiaB n=1 Tax=Fusobacterium sp. SB021 TaxID=2744227 RepID=UPI003CF412EA